MTKQLLLHLTSDEIKLIEYNGLLHLDLSYENQFIWKNTVIGTEVILLGNSLKYFLSAKVIDKFINKGNNEYDTPLGLQFELKTICQVKAVHNLKYLKRYSILNLNEFNELIASSPVKTSAKLLTPAISLFHLTSSDKLNVDIAKHAKDYIEISKFSKYHSFGIHNALLAFICKSNSKIVGAALLSLGNDSEMYHRRGIEIFGHKYFEYRKNGVFINRLYSDINASSKLSIHECLLKSIINISQHILGERLTFIEGVSYEYHPIAEKLDFYIETPRTAYGSFYFWKPFHEYLSSFKKEQNINEIKSIVHQIIKKRNEQNHWMILGTRENLIVGINQNKWALIKNRNNTGRWKNLKSNDIVFFFSKHDNKLLGYGCVDNTAFSNEKYFQTYPLLINFSKVVAIPNPFNIRQEDFHKIYDPYLGGIFPIHSKIGDYLRNNIDNFINPKKMWLTPNPYLLHQTKFEIIPKQVFLIQAHKISESILPVIREILANAGYSLRYYTDRDGQVVFDDIWVLLNQSEAVIVDFTDKRPNVYLEYGMALVIGKPIIAISQEISDLPSDTPNLKCIFYENKKNDSNLERRLIPSIEQTINDINRLNIQNESIFNS